MAIPCALSTLNLHNQALCSGTHVPRNRETSRKTFHW